MRVGVTGMFVFLLPVLSASAVLACLGDWCPSRSIHRGSCVSL